VVKRHGVRFNSGTEDDMGRTIIATRRNGRDQVRTVDAELLEQELRSGRVIHVVDIRTRAEFESATGHIAGANCVPLHHLGTGEDVGCAHSHPIVVVSERGTSAKLAAVELELSGFTEVRALDGGMARWLELGFPTARSRNVEPKRLRPRAKTA
jgi:rhodanese-related sulfurtransferase